jgi:hypothetical protein
VVHIYYHIYATDGVESIIDEQLNLIKNHFDFPYKLNVGISIAGENESTSYILNKFDSIGDIRAKGHEFTTLELIEKDKENFGDSDYILYLHTKGASKQNDPNYLNIVSWRHLMNYFNIEKVKNVFKLFEKTNFNTYGILLCNTFYSGNVWWSKADYIKTIDLSNIKRTRWNAEINYIKNGLNWKPYSPYNRDNENPYSINFKRDEYAK